MGNSVYTLGIYCALLYWLYVFEHNRRRFYFFPVSLSVTMGIAFSANLFTLYLFYELLTLVTYPLVIHEGKEKDHKAGLRYIIYSFSGAGLVLFALFATFGFAGSLDFAQGGIFTEAAGCISLALSIIFFCYLLDLESRRQLCRCIPGCRQPWLRQPLSVLLLHAVAVVKSGVFGILRVMYSVYGTDLMKDLNLGIYVVVIISDTILLASIIAMRQDFLKRRLAFSTISQLGYITLGGALLTQMGLNGGLLHLLTMRC